MERRIDGDPGSAVADETDYSGGDMWIRRFVRAAAWTVAGGAVLVFALYLAMVAINWRDETPSPQALRLQRVVDARPAVPDEANAYVFVLGLAPPRGQDPLALGRTRKALLDAPPSERDPGAPFAVLSGIDVNHEDARTPGVRDLEKACRQGTEDCAQRLERQIADVDQWLASEGWLLERYLQLIQRSQWVESIPADPAAPMAHYQEAMTGQKLLLAKAWRHARDGQDEAARGLLQQDLVFWRMVLRSSDILISKMIATAAIERHFTFGNLVVRTLQSKGEANPVPESWRDPIHRDERSMLRALAGEWRFSTGMMEVSAAAPHTLSGRLLWPMFQPQATRNLFAQRLATMVDRLDVEMSELPRVAEPLAMRAQGEWFRFYNPVGNVLAAIGSDSDYAKYGLRVADLEGTRRIALLAAQLRDAGVIAEQAAPRIAGSALKDPYTGAAFQWDEAIGSIVFTGLEQGERGRHAVLL